MLSYFWKLIPSNNFIVLILHQFKEIVTRFTQYFKIFFCSLFSTVLPCTGVLWGGKFTITHACKPPGFVLCMFVMLFFFLLSSGSRQFRVLKQRVILLLFFSFLLYDLFAPKYVSLYSIFLRFLYTFFWIYNLPLFNDSLFFFTKEKKTLKHKHSPYIKTNIWDNRPYVARRDPNSS